MRCKPNVRYEKFRSMDLMEVNNIETLILLRSLNHFSENPKNHENDRKIANEMYELIMRKIKEREPR